MKRVQRGPSSALLFFLVSCVTVWISGLPERSRREESWHRMNTGIEDLDLKIHKSNNIQKGSTHRQTHWETPQWTATEWILTSRNPDNPAPTLSPSRTKSRTATGDTIRCDPLLVRSVSSWSAVFQPFTVVEQIGASAVFVRRLFFFCFFRPKSTNRDNTR